jgi:ferredoxin-type protein NapG
MTEKLNRREFLTLNFESTIGFLGNFLAPQIEVERNFFRPPGSCDELEFLTSCTRCGKCQEICPEQSICLFPIKSGAQLLNTPYLDPNKSACTLCKKCIDVCPTSALNHTDFDERPNLGGHVKVISGSCLGYQNVMCDYCVRSCPVPGALSILNGIPIVSFENCTGCGICVSSCIAEGSALKVIMVDN